MIIFDQLKLNNWISFYGNQLPIVFAKDEKKNVTFILADNEVGKTSILRGIQWCMFGKTHDPKDSKKYKKHFQRLNFQAADEKNYNYFVELKLLHNNKNYVITRAASIDSSLEPEERNFKEELTCIVEGKIFKDKKAQLKVNEIFDFNSSRFYLFDGEMLNEYEELLVSENISDLSKKIKFAIEDLLQITQLRHARKSLQRLAMNANDAFQSDESNNSTAREIAKKIHNLNIDIDAYETQITELEIKRAEYQIDLEKAQEIFTQNSSERVDGERLADIKSNDLPNCITDISNLEEQLTQHAKTSYIGIIDKVAIKTIEKLNSKREALNKKLQKIGNNKLYVDLIDNTDISEESKKVIHSYITKTSNQNEDVIESEIYKINTKIKSIKLLDPRGANLPLMLKIYNELASARELKISLENEEKNLLDKIGKDKSEVIANAKSSMQKNNSLIARASLALNPDEEGTVANKKLKLEEDVRMLELSMPNDVGDKSLSSVTLSITQEYKDFFEGIVNKKVSKAKNEIEINANAIYEQLREYKEIDNEDDENSSLKLVINDNYGIGIKSGTRELTASAGGSQIVALSLIFSLRNILESKAPILMDTPMARLDTKYRKGLLEVAPNQGTQFILLVHDGEIDPESALHSLIRPRIGKTYKLKKENTRHSEIESD
jgi:DNA sulfur modification protein DndD